MNNFNPSLSTPEHLDTLISRALSLNASDIHFQSAEQLGTIRFRIDGLLHNIQTFPMNRMITLISRIKVLAGLDSAEKRRPQDGKWFFTSSSPSSTAPGSDKIDIRVSIVPVIYGENAVLRLLDNRRGILNLDTIGLSPSQISLLKANLLKPNGIILVTGPTGSGKTTSLYAALSELNTKDKNILTIEDPVEYIIDGINQSQIRPDLGFSFPEALRSFLRQDPDIILVGEIRDSETAVIALRAALTGHLVLSTLHTNDSITAVSRLTDLGIPPFLLADSLRLIIAQRLVRKLCSCKKNLPDGTAVPVGCSHCFNSGYKGRTAVFEFLPVSPAVSQLIRSNAPSDILLASAVEAGFTSILDSIHSLFKSGIISSDEILRHSLY